MSNNIIKLGVGIPAYGGKVVSNHCEMFLSLGITLAASEQRFSFVMLSLMDTCGVDIARNRIFESAFAHQCDWVLMVDCDTYHTDGYNILRMISEADRIEDAAVVVAPVPKRDPMDSRLMIYKHNDKGQRIPIKQHELEIDKLTEIDSAATALMAVNINFVKSKLTPPWFRFVYVDGTTRFLSEDLHFCQLVKANGGKIFADGRFKPNHLQRPEII